MSDPTLELRAGALRLALRPDLGACIAGLWHGELAVLRSSEGADLVSSRPSGCFPLVPYSNRVGHRRFDWRGQSHTLAANFDSSAHAVHGVVWKQPWTVANAGAREAELVVRHGPDGHWPWAFETRQRFELTPESLTVTLSFTNLADVTQPVGLGWHPYFPQRSQSRLDIDVNARWISGADELPTHAVPHAGIHAAVADLALDNCFDGFQGVARIEDEHLSLELSSDLSRLVVFTPGTRPYFCVEPVSHVSNAIQSPDPLDRGLRSVPPQGRTAAWMKLAVRARGLVPA